MLFEKIFRCCIFITIATLFGGVLGMWYATPNVSMKPSVSSQTRQRTIVACGHAVSQGRSSASLYYLGIEFPIEMQFSEEHIPDPDFCEEGSVLGDTCFVMVTTRHLESCTLK